MFFCWVKKQSKIKERITRISSREVFCFCRTRENKSYQHSWKELTQILFEKTIVTITFTLHWCTYSKFGSATVVPSKHLPFCRWCLILQVSPATEDSCRLSYLNKFRRRFTSDPETPKRTSSGSTPFIESAYNRNSC